MASDKKEYSKSISILFVVFLLIAGLLFLIFSNIHRPYNSTSSFPRNKINYSIYFKVLSKFDPSLNMNNLTKVFDRSGDVYIPLNPLMSGSSKIYHWKIYSKGKYEGSYSYFNLSEENLFFIYYNNSLIASELYYFSNKHLFNSLSPNYQSFVKSYSCKGNLTVKTLNFSESPLHVQGYEATYLPTGQVTTQIIVSKNNYPSFTNELVKTLNCSEKVR